MQPFNRRQFITHAAMASAVPLLPPLALAQLARNSTGALKSDWNVLFDQPEFKDPENLVPNYLRRAIETNEADREKAIASLKTPADFERYRAVVRQRLHEAIGTLPERSPLHARSTGKLDRGDYSIEKVIFESRPEYYVTANVYVPRRFQPPFPAVLCPVGHWGTGKANEDYQRLCIYLARRGFLALIFDLPAQGERLMYYDPVVNRSIVDPATSEYYVTVEHGVAVGQTTLVSGNLVPYLVWDGIRALDYLCERQDVDRDRLACTGTSGGGLQTELLSALDDRIKVAIPVSYGGCAADHPDGPGLTMLDVDALIAPRPLLMMAATGDSRSGVLAKRTRYQFIASLYRMLDAADRTSFLITEGRHGYLHDQREAAYRWLTRWLQRREASGEELGEPPTAIESGESLACTGTGQVKTALGGHTIPSLNRSAAASIRTRVAVPGSREGVPQWRDRLRKEIAARLKVQRTPPRLNPRVVARIDKGSWALEKVVYYAEPDLYSPALLFLPKAPQPGPGIVFVNEGGKNADGAAETYGRALAEAGCAVLAIDVRGMGETTPPTSEEYNHRNYRGFTEDAEADLFYDALRSGKTILGLRTLDVLAGVDYLQSRTEVDAGRVGVIGHGMGGLLALYAAALDDRIQSVAATGMLLSYAAILETDLYAHRPSAFAPGVLRSFDLPDLAALLAPRALVMLNLVDQTGQRAPAERATRTYQPASSLYGLLGAEEHFKVETADSAEALIARYVGHFR